MTDRDLLRDEQDHALRGRVRNEISVRNAELPGDRLDERVLVQRAHLEQDLADRSAGLPLALDGVRKLLARDQALLDEHLAKRLRSGRHRPISPGGRGRSTPFNGFVSAFGLRARPLYLGP